MGWLALYSATFFNPPAFSPEMTWGYLIDWVGTRVGTAVEVDVGSIGLVSVGAETVT